MIEVLVMLYLIIGLIVANTVLEVYHVNVISKAVLTLIWPLGLLVHWIC